MSTRQVFILRIQPLPGVVPVANRLRRALKSMLRVFGLKLLTIGTQEHEAEPTTEEVNDGE